EQPPSAQAVAEALAELERDFGPTLVGSRPVLLPGTSAAMASDPTLAAPPPRAGSQSGTATTAALSHASPPERRRVLPVACVLGRLGAGAGAAVWLDPLGRLRPAEPGTAARAAPKEEARKSGESSGTKSVVPAEKEDRSAVPEVPSKTGAKKKSAGKAK